MTAFETAALVTFNNDGAISRIVTGMTVAAARADLRTIAARMIESSVVVSEDVVRVERPGTSHNATYQVVTFAEMCALLDTVPSVCTN
jgi:hypothetical protein